MVGAGWVSGSRTDTPVPLGDELVVVELLAGFISPELSANSFVHAFGKRFRQTVCECLGQDAAVIVVTLLETSADVLQSDTSGYHKRSHIICEATPFGSNEVREAHIGSTGRLLELLAQPVNGGQYLRAILVRVQCDVVVVDCIRGKETDDGVRRQQLVAHHSFEQLRCIVVQRTCRLAHNGIIEDLGILALQLPGLEERRPVYPAHQLVQRIISKDSLTDHRRLRGAVIGPVQRELSLASPLNGEDSSLGLAIGV